MGLYIKGMEMPDKMTVLMVYPNGYTAVYDASDTFIGEAKAVHVPPHGRLIDADALVSKDRQIYRSDGAIIGARRYIEFSEIEDAPTVIPSEEDEHD